MHSANVNGANADAVGANKPQAHVNRKTAIKQQPMGMLGVTSGAMGAVNVRSATSLCVSLSLLLL
jgi:hypothetical protein